MKQWVEKLMQQLDVPENKKSVSPAAELPQISDEKATLLFIIDVYNKHLFDMEKHNVRKVREKLDTMAKDLLNPDPKENDRTLFEIRQFFSSYRIDECSYIQNTFDDFKRIIWDIADHLSGNLRFESTREKKLAINLNEVKESVEANSIDGLRVKSREFINAYVEYQEQKNDQSHKKVMITRKNLDAVKMQLEEATQNLNIDHLTEAHNRKSFDEYSRKLVERNKTQGGASSLLMLDIDFFKKINDTYGHDTGDFVLKELVRSLKQVFTREEEMVARIGGEEFVVVLPDHRLKDATERAEEVLTKIRGQVLKHGEHRIAFTASIGVAQLQEGEDLSGWLKRADTALYQSKNSGRNRYTIAPSVARVHSVA